jgi:hypothetical protein
MRRVNLNAAGRRGPNRSLLLRGLLLVAATLVSAIAVMPAAATPASFDSQLFGFDPAGLGGLPSITIDAEDDFLTAGDPASPFGPWDVDISGTSDICLFTAASPVCQSDTAGITGPYSVLVTFEVTAVHAPGISGPFTMFLTTLLDNDPSNLYAANELAIELDPTIPVGLDVSGIAGFNLRPFVHVVDEFDAPQDIYHYVGWTVQLGDTVSFRYDVFTAPGNRSTPALAMNVVGRVVPEPGTALLMGLGLVGLAMGDRRIARKAS